MDSMIEGINPLVISSIMWVKSRRRGKHPLWYKFSKKKHPILWSLGFIEPGYYDYFDEPKVLICGSDGNVLRSVSCRSNDSAKALCRELNKKLDKFIESVRVELQ